MTRCSIFRLWLPAAIGATALLACDAAPPPVEDAAPAQPVTLADGLVEQLAAGSDPHTLYTIGNDYAVGAGVDKDQDIAERLWKVACDKGHAFACSNYGSRQIEHNDFDEAERYLKLAAEAGVVPAIRNLSELYDNHSWSGASVEESIKWFTVLQALENPEPDHSALEGDQ